MENAVRNDVVAIHHAARGDGLVFEIEAEQVGIEEEQVEIIAKGGDGLGRERQEEGLRAAVELQPLQQHGQPAEVIHVGMADEHGLQRIGRDSVAREMRGGRLARVDEK